MDKKTFTSNGVKIGHAHHTHARSDFTILPYVIKAFVFELWMNNCGCMDVRSSDGLTRFQIIFIRSINVMLYAISNLEFNDATHQKKWSHFTIEPYSTDMALYILYIWNLMVSAKIECSWIVSVSHTICILCDSQFRGAVL